MIVLLDTNVLLAIINNESNFKINEFQELIKTETVAISVLSIYEILNNNYIDNNELKKAILLITESTCNVYYFGYKHIMDCMDPYGIENMLCYGNQDLEKLKSLLQKYVENIFIEFIQMITNTISVFIFESLCILNWNTREEFDSFFFSLLNNIKNKESIQLKEQFDHLIHESGFKEKEIKVIVNKTIINLLKIVRDIFFFSINFNSNDVLNSLLNEITSRVISFKIDESVEDIDLKFLDNFYLENKENKENAKGLTNHTIDFVKHILKSEEKVTSSLLLDIFRKISSNEDGFKSNSIIDSILLDSFYNEKIDIFITNDKAMKHVMKKNGSENDNQSIDWIERIFI